jgi:mono/diheme cytochrome c family protein
MIRPSIDGISRSGAFSILAFCVLTICGCSRAPIPEYVVSEEVSALPELHRDQIVAFARQHFGTPLNPRLAAPADDEEVVVDEEGEGDESTAVDETEPNLTDLVDRRQLAHGAEVYRSRCAGCHGVSGDGNGEAAAYLQPKPRDYRKGIFKFTSTPYGLKPTRADLVRTIRRGAKGTSMPAFPWMTDEDVEAVVDYVISLSQRGEFENLAVTLSEDYEEDEEIDSLDLVDALATIQSRWQGAEEVAVQPISSPPPYADESIIAGRQAFLSKGCSKCHGEDGKGQTEWLSHEFLGKQESLPESERTEINYDAWGNPAPAANITAGMLHGGRRQLDIYRRIFTGINGTPMPSFGQTLATEPETIWNMVHYVQSIVEGRDVDFGDMTADAAGESTEAAVTN